MFSRICAFILYRLLGWKIQGIIPREQPRMVFLLLPHTSNWDFVMVMLFIKAEKIKLTIFGKNAFYFFPFTYAYRYFRVVPIRRDKSNNFVAQSAKLYADKTPLWTAMAPEGTRGQVNKLRSGYYYLAKTADVPVTVVGLDFKKKQLVVSKPRAVLPSFEEDADDLIAFSHLIIGKRAQRRIEPNQD